MARGPFQGNWNSNLRPTVVMAPDAIVYINGETDVIGCSTCKRKFDFNKYITQIQVSLDVDSVPGTASISLSVPRHVIDDFYFDGNPVLTPMMEVEIYAKGYYLLEGLPQYYPIFWGLITEVGDNYSSGEHTVSISCADILKWWDICRMNVNPAYTAPTPMLGRSIFGNVLFGTNPYDLIFTLAQMSFGDVIIGTGSLTSLYVENGQKSTFNAALGDIMQYWQGRFSRLRSNLLLYGVNGVAIRGDSVATAYEQHKFSPTQGLSPIASAVRNANGGPLSAQLAFDPTDPNVVAFRTQFSQAGEINFWQSEYQTKLEIANACKEAAGFEFYMDVTGDIVFKPPFYNLDILSNKPVSWIQDIDIIDWDFTENESEVVTQLSINGSFAGPVEYGFGPEITPFTSVTDYHLLRKYGWRPHALNAEFMNDTVRMFYYGLDMLDRINSKRHQGTVIIPIRPELRLGFPVYIAPKDQVWYVKGISHNIAFGGRATTSLTLTAKREKFVAIKGISTLKTKGSPGGSSSGTPSINSTTPKTSSPTTPSTSTGKPTGPATIRQLANTSFSLELGDAATVPPVNADPNNPSTLTPYEPMILRHPKTGKIVGYPNAVMVYTRPYDGTSGYSQIRGQKDPGTNKKEVKQDKKVVDQRQKQEIAIAQQATAFGQTDVLQGKYANNRYSYGLNSAGVYVYAHDVDQVVTQFALIPSKNIAVTGGTLNFNDSGIKLESPTSMVRPVSDERGFEVIGHYRYGRGVSLRDGSLVFQQGQKNQQATVSAQLALGGDLYSTLTAQSQGITSVTTTYPNPAAAVANLQPEDLQTAGTMVPDQTGGKTPQFSNQGTNFVDSAPLGSPEAEGLPASVEASQLSRALTLAEMTARSDLVPGDPNCPCQTMRSDLAFINVGYQVKTIKASAPDNSQLSGGGSTGNGTVSFGSFGNADGGTSYTNAPVLSSTMKTEDVMTVVEGYLWNLYSALDGPHQDFENSLRGNPSADQLQGEITGQQQLPDLFQPPAPESNLSPPFSAMDRASLGDPEAIALQGSSALGDLQKSFSDFGVNLKANTTRAQLQSQITSLTAQLNLLNNQLTSSTPGTVTIGKSDPAAIQAQINKVQQNIANLQTQLAQLG